MILYIEIKKTQKSLKCHKINKVVGNTNQHKMSDTESNSW